MVKTWIRIFRSLWCWYQQYLANLWRKFLIDTKYREYEYVNYFILSLSAPTGSNLGIFFALIIHHHFYIFSYSASITVESQQVIVGIGGIICRKIFLDHRRRKMSDFYFSCLPTIKWLLVVFKDDVHKWINRTAYFRNRCFGNGGFESKNDGIARIVVIFLSGQYAYCILSSI